MRASGTSESGGGPGSTSAAVSAPTTSHSAVPAACAIGVLTLIDSGVNEVRGTQAYGTIRARNTGPRTCTITGYPGIKILQNHQASPTKLAHAAGRQPHTVTLAPDAVASFGFSHAAQGRVAICDQIDGFRVYDPDGSGYRDTDTTYTNCGEADPSLITVGPFEPGSAASIRP